MGEDIHDHEQIVSVDALKKEIELIKLFVKNKKMDKDEAELEISSLMDTL